MWYVVKNVMFNKKNIFYFLIVISFLLAQTACDIILPLMLTKLNGVIQEWADPINNHTDSWVINRALIISGIMLGVCIVELFCGVIGELLGTRLGIKLAGQLRYNTYSKIQKLSFADFDHFKSSTLLTTLTTDIQTIQNAFVFVFRIGFRSLFLYFGGIIGVVAIVFTQETISSSSWLLPTIMVAISLSLFVILGFIMFKATKYYRLAKFATDDVNSSIQENILGVRVVKSFNLQEKQIAKFDIINERMRKITTKSFVITMWVFPIINFALTATIVIILWVGTTNQSISITNVSTLMSITTLVIIGMMLFINVIVLVSMAIGSANRIKNILQYKPTLTFVKDGKKIENNTVEFKDVSFRYHETSDYVLKNINFKIKENETIGIIGGTGAGKSTLVNLIARMYDIKTGEILVSNHNVKEIDEVSLRSKIALSPQKVTLFSGTIASNLRFGKENATIEEMTEAAKAAQAYDFIMQKENGFDSVVEQRGSNFSGGQKQRLSIARALIMKPKILILDSSTSALDMITEKAVNDYIKSSNNDRTTLIVSQRISGVKDADRIFVLDKGEIVGIGSHKELLKNCSQYYEIALSQMGEEGVQNEMK